MLTVCQHANYLSLSIHGSVHGSTFYLVLFISNYLFIVIPYICISLSMYSSIYFCLYRYLSIYLSIYLYILYLTIIFVLSTYVCQFFCLSIHLSVSIHLFTYFNIYISFTVSWEDCFVLATTTLSWSAAAAFYLYLLYFVDHGSISADKHCGDMKIVTGGSGGRLRVLGIGWIHGISILMMDEKVPKRNKNEHKCIIKNNY